MILPQDNELQGMVFKPNQWREALKVCDTVLGTQVRDAMDVFLLFSMLVGRHEICRVALNQPSEYQEIKTELDTWQPAESDNQFGVKVWKR